MNTCGSLCVFVDEWPVSLTVRVSRETPLSTLVQKPHKEQCPQKPATLEEEDRSQLGVGLQTSQLGVRLQSKELES